jgi:ATP-binding cassette, subfamily B, bacterial MsbA
MPTLAKRLARLWPYVSSSRWGLAAAALAALATAVTEPLVSEVLRNLLDRGFKPDGLALWVVPVALIGLFSVRSLASFVAQVSLAWVTQRGIFALREKMFTHVLHSTPLLFTEHSASSLNNTVVYEAQGGATGLASCLLTLVRDSLILVALLTYLFYLNWQLTLIAALVFPLVAAVMRWLGKRLHNLAVESQKATDELAYVVEENLLAWRIVRLFGGQPQQLARFLAGAHTMRRLAMKSAVASSTMTPVTQIMAACALSVVITMAMAQGRSGTATVGEFVAFVTAMLQLVAPAKHLSDVMAPLVRSLAAVERGLDMVEQGAVEQGGSYTGAPAAAGHTGAAAHNTTPGRARGEIVFEAVGLRYKTESAPALQDLSVRVRAGETVALVGPSGAGKTSLVNLLPRFVEPTTGRITLDGRPLTEWNMLALRHQFALVSQDVILFNDSVLANVALGAGISRQAVRDALQAAHLLEFVDRLPQGLDTPIGHNGSQLSGGQRQRLAIARALAKDAPVLILDEATSALDSESERAVQEALERLMQGRTTLVIAHRLSTIEHADRVLVLDGGRLVEQGPHQTLLSAGGLYARLHAMQFKA